MRLLTPAQAQADGLGYYPNTDIWIVVADALGDVWFPTSGRTKAEVVRRAKTGPQQWADMMNDGQDPAEAHYDPADCRLTYIKVRPVSASADSLAEFFDYCDPESTRYYLPDGVDLMVVRGEPFPLDSTQITPLLTEYAAAL